jgi:hypothetical protein
VLGLAAFAERIFGGDIGAAGVAPPRQRRVAGQVQFVLIRGRQAGPVAHGGALQGLARGGFLGRVCPRSPLRTLPGSVPHIEVRNSCTQPPHGSGNIFAHDDSYFRLIKARPYIGDI